MELRRAGVTYAEIAERLGYSDASTACRAVRRAYEALAPTPDDIDALREEEVVRLDAVWERLWPALAASNGLPDLGAMDRLIRLSERRSRLLGLDRPQPVALAGRIDVATLSTDERRSMLRGVIQEAVRRGIVDVDEIQADD